MDINNNNSYNKNNNNFVFTDAKGNPISYAQGNKIHNQDELKLKRNFKSQFNAVLKKNVTYQWRQRKNNACLLVNIIFLVVFMCIINLIVKVYLKDYSTPAQLHPYAGLPSLYLTNSDKCIPKMYPESLFYLDHVITNTNATNEIINNIQQSEQPIGLIFGQSLLGKASTFCKVGAQSLIYPLTMEKIDSNVTQLNDEIFHSWRRLSIMGGYDFKSINNENLELTIVFNKTLTRYKDLPTLFQLVTHAYNSLIGSNSNFTSIVYDGLRDVPHGKIEPNFDLVSLMGPMLYMFIFQMPLPFILKLLIYDKETKLKDLMKMMGLEMKTYWISNYIVSFLLYFISIIFLWAIACLLGFKMFLNNAAIVIFILILAFGHLLVSFSFFLSVFIDRYQMGLYFGYLWVLFTGLFTNNVIHDILDSKFTPESSVFAISLVPAFLLYRGLLGLQNGALIEEITLDNWNDRDYLMKDVIVYMVIEATIFLILALYLEEVVPSKYGVKRHPLFIFKKSFWFKKFNEPITLRPILEGEGPDVHAERDRILNNPQIKALEVLDLNKTYGTKQAVKSLALAVDQGICFGFLGPNGAGKSTTISCVSGLFQPTSGTARVLGMDIRNHFDRISMVLGVCPQDNVLWEDLTGEEHLLFYGRLKNINGKRLKEAVDASLKSVYLDTEAHKMVKQYSGGMKRRLSIAISFMGNPKLVCLDEPTAGLDPATRRGIWNSIKEHKGKCAILLTSHAMEEVQELCDRVGIFVEGEMKCIGASHELMSRYGEGYKIKVSIQPDREQYVTHFITSLVPGARITHSMNNIIQYQLPRSDSVKLSVLFREIQLNLDVGIIDYGISGTTLEEVFLKVCNKKYNEA
ncbi:hypothetical protein CYY_008108 [Polysphondylium violaceum]|uniref:ABC transporter domain-containing protein n=1 Tax=Polysphondylium violaceum TaxID=133409 RepID=A0A8J4V1M1_9MYCE|nr:hypothetical protein CYY_008108 [Polysphondylium violaceum]